MICTHCEEEFSNEADLMEHIELCEEGPGTFEESHAPIVI